MHCKFFNVIGCILIFTLILSCQIVSAQYPGPDFKKEFENLNKKNEDLEHRLDEIEKAVDDVLWYDKVGDVAFIDKVFLTGPPPAVEKNPTALGAGNPVKFWAYIFIPKNIDLNKKYPLLVFPHGGVHANFTTYHTHIIRELIWQQYIVVSAEYRGSTGYGKSLYERIDYGGREIEDVDASRVFMIENYDFIDADRVGIIGWSHGGLIALMNIFDHPENYKVAFAGVPVSDLVARMGYYDEEYRKLYSADYHIGKTANENVAEYRKRSPVWNVQKLKTPLLIHTNTNDEDVNVLEVEQLIRALKAENKKFEYEIFENLPGGHSFDRLDTKKAREIRIKIYKFLGGFLQPPKKMNSLVELNQAAYK